MLLQIGEFARITGLPVRTIRYYGDLGLLHPAEVDPSSGYRYYQVAQVERANRLMALKESGLSLEEIGLVLDDQLTAEQFRDLLEAKVAELADESNLINERLQRAQAQLDLITRRLEETVPDVTIKTTERTTIAFIRDQIGGIEQIGAMFPKLFAAVDPQDAVGPAANIYHYFSDDGSSIDLEAAIPVPDGYASNPPAETRVIEPVQVASLTHHGAFNRLHEAHAQLLAWVEANGYTVSGPSYEWNLVCTEPVTQDNESYITEVQVEVTKR